MIRKRRDPFKLRRLRQIVQLVFLAAFAFLLVKALFGRVLGSYVPLLVLTLFILILTLVLGRVWCGWVCPMGTVLYWTRFKGAIERRERLSDRWWAVKYVLLLFGVDGHLAPVGSLADPAGLSTLVSTRDVTAEKACSLLGEIRT